LGYAKRESEVECHFGDFERLWLRQMKVEEVDRGLSKTNKFKRWRNI
jgi:hypothetical protein